MDNNIKEQFTVEAIELLMKIEKGLLVLEKKPDDCSQIEEIFRGLHTLKGSSSMYGFGEVGHLMHLIESIFDKIRAGEKGSEISIINLSLETVDFCSKLLKLGDEKPKHITDDYYALIKKIQAECENADLQLSDGYNVKKNTKSDIMQTYLINFSIDQNFEKRGIKLNSVFEELEQIGTVISIPVQNDQNEPVSFWEVFLVTASQLTDIEDIFIFMADIVSIEKLADENLFLDDEFKQTVQKNAALKVKNDISDLRRIINRIKIEENEAKNKSKQVTEQSRHSHKSYLRVAADKLDEQMDLLSELVTVKAELRLIVENKKYSKLLKIVESFDKIANRFRKNILNVRLVQVKQWYVMFLRLVRDMSKQLGKEVEFIAEGLETEIDKNIIDSLEGPLTHLIRNCLDHGIEMPEERIKAGKPSKGKIILKAYHSGSEIIIEIGDDGRGFDKKKIYQKALDKGLINNDFVASEKQLFDFVFLPGFSTSTQISEVSGRGVGMDVVKKAVSQLRGEIEIHSVEGKGTNFRLKLPMLLSIIDTLLIRTEDQYFAIPLPDVQKCCQITLSELSESTNEQFTLDGKLIPYINLRKVFAIRGQMPEKQKIVVIENSQRNIGLVTDEVIGEYQAVLKPFDGYYINKQYFIGASLLADGHLCVILDTLKLLNEKKNLIN